ncbi:hypothetical protein [Hyalangium minutum]|uniref:hypothetical protein n=1 Tax=Hyalangium minutum TaxID=394096 RepID=UPI0005C5A59A|nr:hypothetical protein [Hyalangium minutum]
MRCGLVLSVSALLVLGAGCATTGNERRTLLERASAEIAYEQPSRIVMDAAKGVLRDHGYVLAPSRGKNALRTQWKIDGDLETTARWSKVLIVGQYRSDGRFIVRAEQVVWATGGRTAAHPSIANGDAGKRGSDSATNYVPGEAYSPAKPVFSRALDLEWEILQRVEPRFANEVEKQVDIYLSGPHS